MLDVADAPERPKSTLEACRACNAPEPHLFLPMGKHSPAQMLVDPAKVDEPHPAFPLNTQVCLSCGLVQVADQIPEGFFRHYLYVPSGAATMHKHFHGLATVLAERAGTDGLIVDIGSNDGLLLAELNARGYRTMGFDPAENIAKLAAERGVQTYIDYFHPASADAFRERYGAARVIVTTNTFNHIGDLANFMEGIDILLADDGIFVIEVPHVQPFVTRAEFDNIYHEHVSEFSLLSVAKLGQRFGLDVTDVTMLERIHGGSMRIFLTRTEAGIAPSPEVDEVLRGEEDAGLLQQETYDRMVEVVDDRKERLVAMLEEIKAQGKTIAGYGASARGNTLITYYGLGKYLDFLVDKNPLKHGMLSPNTLVRIKPVEAIEEERPDYLLLLAWNFAEEIREQQSAFVARDGRFIVPFPEPHFMA